MDKDQLMARLGGKTSAVKTKTQSQKTRLAIWAWRQRRQNNGKEVPPDEEFYIEQTDKFIDWVNNQER